MESPLAPSVAPGAVPVVRGSNFAQHAPATAPSESGPGSAPNRAVLVFLRADTTSFTVDRLLQHGRAGGDYERVLKARPQDADVQARLDALGPGRYRVSCHGARGRFLGTTACEVAFRGAGLVPVSARVSSAYRKQGRVAPMVVGRMTELRELLARQAQQHLTEVANLRRQLAAGAEEVARVRREGLEAGNLRVEQLQAKWKAHHAQRLAAARQDASEAVTKLRQERDRLRQEVKWLAPVVLELDKELRFVSEMGRLSLQSGRYLAGAAASGSGLDPSYFAGRGCLGAEDRKWVESVIARLPATPKG